MHNTISHGARLLGEAGSIAATAKRLGVAERTVSAWRSGDRSPGTSARYRMREALGIAFDTWDRIAPTTPVRVAEAPDEAIDDAPDGDTVVDLRSQLARVRRAREEPGLTSRVKLDLEKLELGVLQALARIEEHRLSEAEILKAPAWRRLESVLADAIAPWPDALAAVADATRAAHQSRV